METQKGAVTYPGPHRVFVRVKEKEPTFLLGASGYRTDSGAILLCNLVQFTKPLGDSVLPSVK